MSKRDADESFLTNADEFDPIGQIVKAMKFSNITQKQLADKLSVKPSTVSMWLNKINKMSLDDFVNIVNVLDLPFDYFLKTNLDLENENEVKYVATIDSSERIPKIYKSLEFIKENFSYYIKENDLTEKDEKLMNTMLNFIIEYLSSLKD